MFDNSKPTVEMLGRYQPWHDGHTELFKRAQQTTGQVAIMVRDVKDASGGEGQDDNPFDFNDVIKDISTKLLEKGFTIDEDYIIIKVPNIVDISYGRGVGYTFTEHDLGKDIHNISATKIRERMRKEGKLDAKH